MLQVHCPHCDAPIDVQTAEAAKSVPCWRCGQTFAAAPGPELRPEANGICAADPWSVHLPAFPGKRAVRLVQRLAIQRGLLACPACGKDVSRRAVVCPSCGRMLKQRTRQWLSRAEWRTIGVATILFVGVPAAVIFFLVVLCAPRGH